jgi:tRNA (adenine22-N1)-methyltransferase
MVKSKRIQFLAELTQGYDSVIDIGTDHGFVLQKAFENKYIKRGIATDLREKPLASAMKNLKNYPTTFVLSNGFLNVNESFDLAIIAGMGATLICDILEHAPYGNEIYLLQANDKIEILRAYLVENDFELIDEFIIYDKFYYVILKVKRGEMILSQEDLYLGPYLKNKSEAIPYYVKKAAQIEKIMSKADENRKEELVKMLKIYKNI